MEWERTLAAPKKKTATSGLLAQEHPSATAATAGTAATAATPQTEEPAAMHGSGSSYGTAPVEPPGGLLRTCEAALALAALARAQLTHLPCGL